MVVTGRDPVALAQLRHALPGVRTVENDIGSPAERALLARFVEGELPELDVLVNNAGIQRRVSLAQDRAPWSERQRELDILLSAPIHLDHLLVPVMLAHGRPSTVVTVTSGGALIPQPFAPVYSAAKAAVHSYTATLRLALAGTSIDVCELMPPAVATGLSGAEVPHGAPVDAFCDAAFDGILAGRPTIGFGPTDTAAIRERLEVERAMFESASGRFAVTGYAAGLQ